MRRNQPQIDSNTLDVYYTIVMVQKYSGWLPEINAASSVPVYEQIIEAVALSVTAGELRPGDPLPSVRALASELRINPNTAARALRELEIAQLSVPVKGVGSTVAEHAVGVAADRASAALARELEGVVEVATRLGLSIDEVCGELRQRWESDENAD